MIFGYRRVSKQDQNLDLQLDALKNAGCEEIYSEKVSGRQKIKPEFEKLYGKLTVDKTNGSLSKNLDKLSV